jgi:hypothetical protein
MKKQMKNILKSLDFFSIETHFLINGEKRYKNSLGGLLSIISSLIGLAAVIFFVREFLLRENSSIISNQEATNKVSIENFKRFPFMIRLSLSGNVVVEENHKVWKIIAARWGTTKNSTKQFSQQLQMEKCNITKHFGEYKYLFENITDLNTFICPKFDEEQNSLYGLYGDTEPYSFYNFAIRPCINELDGNVCENSTYIKNFLNQVFLDVRTVDFSVSNFDVNPAKPFARGDRFTVSQSIFRRIWVSFKTVEYNTDEGLIFSQFRVDRFHHIEQFNSEVDMRDQKTNVTPYTFLWITLINSSNKVVYYRTYMKAQTLLANVGGVIKGIMSFASVINFFISMKLYYSKLINVYECSSISAMEPVAYVGLRKPAVVDVKKFKFNFNNKNLKNSNNDNYKANLDGERIYSSGSQYRLQENNVNIFQVGKLNDHNNHNEKKKQSLNEVVLNKKTLNQLDIETKNDQKAKSDFNSEKKFDSVNSKTFKFFKLTLREVSLPFFCSKKSHNQSFFTLGQKKVKEALDIQQYIKSMNNLEALQNFVLDNEQLCVFKYAFDYKKPDESFNFQEVDLSIGKLRGKADKTHVDKTLLDFCDKIF